MRNLWLLTLVAFSNYALISAPAYAYIGPGLGVGAVGAVLGVVGAILLALFAVIYYPIKRAIRRFRKKPDPVHTADPE